MGSRIENLDVVRAVAITLIVLHHVQERMFPRLGLPLLMMVYSGFLGVSLFIILSGVLMARSLSRATHGYLYFIRRRILRIFPLYWLAVLFTIALAIHDGIPIDSKNIASTALGLNAYLGYWGGPGNLNGSLWFIGCILPLYILAPFIAAGYRRFGAALMLALSFGLSFGTRYFALFSPYYPRFPLSMYVTNESFWRLFPTSTLFEFCLGFFIFFKIIPILDGGDERGPESSTESCPARNPRSVVRIDRRAAFALGAIIAYAFISNALYNDGNALVLYGFTFAAFALFIVFYLGTELLRRYGRLMHLTMLVSNCSFELFLFHLPLIHLFRTLLPGAEKATAVAGVVGAEYIFVLLAVLIIASMLIHETVERIARARARDLSVSSSRGGRS